jgi:hypothetical protein
MASPRLRALGIEVPLCEGAGPSHRLYELLEREGPGAHSRYNALVRRIASFARAAEHGAKHDDRAESAVITDSRPGTFSAAR